jgi:hypothetical protein
MARSKGDPAANKYQSTFESYVRRTAITPKDAPAQPEEPAPEAAAIAEPKPAGVKKKAPAAKSKS